MMSIFFTMRRLWTTKPPEVSHFRSMAQLLLYVKSITKRQLMDAKHEQKIMDENINR